MLLPDQRVFKQCNDHVDGDTGYETLLTIVRMEISSMWVVMGHLDAISEIGDFFAPC